MRKSGLVAGMLLLGTGIGVQAEPITQYDYLGLPIETGAMVTTATPSATATRDYLDLPVAGPRANHVAVVEPLRSVDNDYLDLPVEKANVAVKTVRRDAEISYLY